MVVQGESLLPLEDGLDISHTARTGLLAILLVYGVLVGVVAQHPGA